jgi:hypothetical protein
MKKNLHRFQILAKKYVPIPQIIHVVSNQLSNCSSCRGLEEKNELYLQLPGYHWQVNSMIENQEHESLNSKTEELHFEAFL